LKSKATRIRTVYTVGPVPHQKLNIMMVRPGLHLVTFTGVKLNINSRPAIFWQCNQDTEPEIH